MIDFSPVVNGDVKLLELSESLTIDDLRAATNWSIDRMLKLIDGLTDEHMTFDPVDPTADDPYAVEGEEKIGWSIAHIIAHVTASSEEAAAFSSLLARGVEGVKARPRYETPWRDVKSKAQCVQRLEESRRIRLAYLNTWPDKPFLDNYRITGERFVAKIGELNAPAAFLFGLKHEVEHYAQLEDVKQQALAAHPVAAR